MSGQPTIRPYGPTVFNAHNIQVSQIKSSRLQKNRILKIISTRFCIAVKDTNNLIVTNMIYPFISCHWNHICLLKR